MWMTLAAMTLANSMILDLIVDLHVDAFQITFYATAAIGLLAAIACFVLVRRTPRVAEGPIFSRRSRWIYANVGSSPGVTKRPPADTA